MDARGVDKETAAAKAGIAYCSMHDLRRTFIGHLAMEGGAPRWSGSWRVTRP